MHIPIGTRHRGVGAASLCSVTIGCKRFAYMSARVSRPFASPPVSRPIYTCVDAAAPPFGCRAAAPTLAPTLAPTVAPTSAPTPSPTPSSPTGWPSPLASKYLPITNPSSDILCSCALACSYPCTERSANIRAHALTHTLTDALTDALTDGFALTPRVDASWRKGSILGCVVQWCPSLLPPSHQWRSTLPRRHWILAMLLSAPKSPLVERRRYNPRLRAKTPLPRAANVAATSGSMPAATSSTPWLSATPPTPRSAT
jgi:hypothetical protein